MIKKLIIFGTIFVLISVGFSGCIDKQGSDSGSQGAVVKKIAQILINEIFYDAPFVLQNEFIELYVWEDHGENVDISGWYVTTFDDDKSVIPTISDLGKFDYISIRSGSGVNDLDASDGSATVYLNRAEPMLDDSDEVALYTNEDVLVDFVRYQGGNGDPVLGNWADNDQGKYADSSEESIQLMGYDYDNSNNWRSSPLSEAAPNIFDFNVPSFNTDVYIHNGLGYPHGVLERARFPIGSVNITASPGHPVDNNTIQRFKEYINFSLDLYNKTGFNDPETGGDGVLDITLVNASSAGENPSSGSTSPRTGSITIYVGFNNITDKWTVEHELIHSIHAKVETDENGNNFSRTSPIRPKDCRFKDEGLCEYFGLKSTMLNYNITECAVLAEAGRFQGYNLTKYFNDTNINIFTDWPADGWGRYIATWLFFKYIAETYGEKKLMKIYEKQRNYGHYDDIDANDTYGIDAINKAFDAQPEHDVNFEGVFINWTIWLWKNYGDKIKLTFDGSFNGTGYLNESGTLNPWGTHYERIKINSSNATGLTFNGNKSQNYSVTVIKKNNSETTGTTTYNFNGSKEIYIEPCCDEIILIKRQLNGERPTTYNISVYESIPINLAPIAIITALPISGDAPLEVEFTGLGVDTDGTISSYYWDFDDGNTSTTQNPIHTYTTPSIYDVVLFVVDDQGAIGIATQTITVLTPKPHIEINSIDGNNSNGSIDKLNINLGVVVPIMFPDISLHLKNVTILLNTSVNNVELSYDSNNYNNDPSGNYFNLSCYDLSDNEFGLIVAQDTDNSCLQENPIVGYEDQIYLTINTNSCFEGLPPSTTVTGLIRIENGPTAEISFTTPSTYSDTTITLQ